MQHHNISDRARQAVSEFKDVLKRTNENDEVFFNLWEIEIDALLKAGLIYPEPASGWFDRVIWRGIHYRVTKGYPNIIIYKRAHEKK